MNKWIEQGNLKISGRANKHISYIFIHLNTFIYIYTFSHEGNVHKVTLRTGQLFQCFSSYSVSLASMWKRFPSQESISIVRAWEIQSGKGGLGKSSSEFIKLLWLPEGHMHTDPAQELSGFADERLILKCLDWLKGWALLNPWLPHMSLMYSWLTTF